MKSLYSLFVGLLVASSLAFAQEDLPDAMVKKVTEDVLTVVRQDKDIQNGNTKKAIALVEVKVLPYFNFQHMTALAMGRDWNKANPEQKKRLAEELNIPLLGQIPIVQSIREGGDAGCPIAFDDNSILSTAFAELAQHVVDRVNFRNDTMDPTQKVEMTH